MKRALLLGAAIAIAPPVAASTFTVNATNDTVALKPATSPLDASGHVTLRSAIMAANAQPGADTIILPSKAVFSLKIGPADSDVGQIVDKSGDLDITDDLTIQGNNSTLSCGGLDRAFDIQNAALTNFVVTIQDLTVNKGISKGALAWGGGINVRAATLNLSNCTINGCVAGISPALADGGAIAVHGAGFPAIVPGILYMTGCTLDRNIGLNGGGIVGGACLLNISNSRITNNSSKLAVPGTGGGAVFISGTTSSVQFTGCTLTGNQTDGDGGGITSFASQVIVDVAKMSANGATRGGGMAGSSISPGVFVLMDSTVSGNTARTDGGGIWNDGPSTFTADTISGNKATSGGGVFTTGPDGFKSNNATFSGNSAESGGGINVQGGTVYFTNATITQNTATGQGGGIANAASVQIGSTILSGNSGPAASLDYYGPIVSHNYNFIGNGNSVVTGSLTGNIYSTTPMLGPLQDNGGPTFTHALLIGSKAIDSQPGASTPTDQRGVARPQDGDGDGTARSDIGAFELAPYSLADAAQALRLAAGLAIANPADMNRLDLEAAAPSTNQIDILDALHIARSAARNGLP